MIAIVERLLYSFRIQLILSYLAWYVKKLNFNYIRMPLYAFKLLIKDEQYANLLRDGVFIENCLQINIRSALYVLYKFF